MNKPRYERFAASVRDSMATTTFSLLSVLLLFFQITADIVPCAAGASDAVSYDLMRTCSVTRYRSLCVHSLAPFKRVPGAHGSRLWARAAVLVTLAETRRASGYVSRLRRALPHGPTGGALQDCAECLSDAVSELRDTVAELRRLQPGSFAWQMSNVQTWVSAALTDQDTCLDGLAELGEQLQGAALAPAIQGLEAKVLNATYLSSNALAIIHRLASSGGRP